MEGRKYISTNFSPSMIERCSGVDFDRSLVLSDLKGIDFISSLTNRPLSNFLQEKGISATCGDKKVKIILLPGDELYLINPNLKLHEMEGEELPSATTITITKITAW